MTEFLPEPIAASPAQAEPGAPLAQPVAQPAAPNYGYAPAPAYGSAPAPAPAPAYGYAPAATSAPAYAYAPPPQYFPPESASRRRMPWWLWVIIGVVVLIVIAAVVAVLAFVGQQTKGFSPNYTGTPVEASDEVGDTVVSDSATVSYNLPPEWVDANDYADFSSVTAGLPPGQTIVGIYFTSEPGTPTPQLVTVFESSPTASGIGTLSQTVDGYFGGLRSSGATFTEPVVGPYSTPNGLEGYVADFPVTVAGTPTEFSAVVVGQGRRVVFVQWISYDGPVDTVARDSFISSLRVDD